MDCNVPNIHNPTQCIDDVCDKLYSRLHVFIIYSGFTAHCINFQYGVRASQSLHQSCGMNYTESLDTFKSLFKTYVFNNATL